MKRVIDWVKSPKSDRVLFIAAVVLLNLVCNKAYLRLDLTRSKSYSLSPASAALVRTLPERLSCRVYFSSNLPARYAAVKQYLNDLLVEYKGAANKNFSYTFVDMQGGEGESEAGGYGLRPLQIQEVKNNEIGFKKGYMGIVLSYMDQVDTIDGITDTASLEYSITTKIGAMIQKADALSSLAEGEKITLTLYMTDELKAFNIAGFDEVEDVVSKASSEVARQSMGRLSYRKVSPPASEMEDLQKRYGVQLINWSKADGSVGMGVLGLVMERPDGKTRLMPLTMERSLFGYMITGLDDMEKTLSDNVTAIMSKVTKVGYITGHGEASLDAEEMQPFVSITQDMYSLEDVNLKEGDIASDIGAIVINGARSPFTDEELYKVDQAVMRGVNVIFLIDPFDEQQSWGGYPNYAPIDSGLGKLLASYGAAVNNEYVLDEDCYLSLSQDYGEMKLYPAPLLPKKQLASDSPVTRNLGNVLFYKCAPVDASAAKGMEGVDVKTLAMTSPKAWTIKENITLNPLMLSPPDGEEEKTYDLAVMMEGRFKSAFDKAPDSGEGEDGITTNTHRAQSAGATRIFVAGTSEIAKGQLVDSALKEPIAIFMRNVVDYVCGNGDLCAMRTKGLTLNTLHGTATVEALAAKYFNQYGIAILSLLFAFILYRKREARRHHIHDRFNPNDTRTGGTKASGAKTGGDTADTTAGATAGSTAGESATGAV